MKHFVYSFMWKRPGSDHLNFGTGLHEGSATSLFEKVIGQPEQWVLLSVIEITKEEYDGAEERGIIG